MPKKQAKEKKETAEKAAASEEKKAIKMLPEKEYERKIAELAESGLTAEKIGEVLKKEGVHSKEYGKKISQILKEKNIYIIPDLKNLEEKLQRIKKHSEANKQDKRAMREKDRVFSQERRLKKYLKIPVK